MHLCPLGSPALYEHSCAAAGTGFGQVVHEDFKVSWRPKAVASTPGSMCYCALVSSTSCHLTHVLLFVYVDNRHQRRKFEIKMYSTLSFVVRILFH